MSIAVIDYGIGNIQSVANALRRVDGDTQIVSDGEELLSLNPDKIVLPGVGAIGRALEQLRERELEAALNALVMNEGRPFLGICVGMQVMADRCEEFGEHKGFGWIPGAVKLLEPNAESGRKIPHIGWNTVELSANKENLLASAGGRDFYFVHSYAIDCPSDYVLATSDYGGTFVSAVATGNAYGIQFHPEKSSGCGEALLRAFLER